MFKYLHHVHYVVEDLDAMVEYLDKNFDLKPQRIEVSKGTTPAREAIYRVGITEVQVCQPLTPDSELAKHLTHHGPGVTHVGWGVDEIENMFDRAVANGNAMRRQHVSVAPRGYKTVNIEKETSQGVGFQLIEDCNVTP
jgi:4-hydroxyphenylpyruvate dioxygenase-like putative hemolysin